VTAFDFTNAPFEVRADLGEAFRRTWDWLASPGSWWTGPERVAIARAARSASACPLCQERKAALSPHAIDGAHAHDQALPEPAVDAVHRLVTDASRLHGGWVEKLAASGVSDGHYVELLGIVVSLISVDAFHRALGLPLEPLPAARGGETRHYRPEHLVDADAFVPMLPSAAVEGPEADLYDLGPRLPNVLRAMSLVPDCVRRLRDLSGAMYVKDVINAASNEGRAIDRRQIELVAGRVSALNDCFY
jgi:hypothetical protein